MRRFAAFIPVMLILALVLVPSSALLAQDTTEVMTPQLTVADQGGDGTVVAIDRVAAVEDGWMVIHADEGGEPGAVLGYAAVPAGVNEGLEVTLDTPIAETGMVWAMLHVDAGDAGVYEFPGDDVPVTIGTIMIVAPLVYEVVAPEAEAEAEAEEPAAEADAVAVTTPDLTAADQGGDGTVVTVGRVEVVEDGWIAIHDDEDGEPTDVLGYAAVPAGVNEGVEVTLDTPITESGLVWAVLHEDTGEVGTFEFPDGDDVLRVGSVMMMVPLVYEVAAPEAEEAAEEPAAEEAPAAITPQLTVGDQGGDGALVTVTNVTAAQDGWMVIHADEGGEPGAVLGYAAVPAGFTENLEVTLDTPIAETGMVWAMLHVDAGEAGVYEFPGDDAPVRIGTIVVMAPLTYEVVVPEAEAEAEAEVAATEAVTETAEMADTAAMTETAEAEAAAETTEAAAETTEAAAETTEAAPAELPMTGANLQDAPGTLPTTGANLQDAPGTLPTTGANLQDAPGTLPTTGAGSALPAVAPALLSMLALAGVALYSRSRNK